MRILCALIIATGAWAQTVAQCEDHRKHGRRDEATRCWAKLSGSSDPFIQAEALWGLKNYNAASKAFEQAAKAKPKDPMVRVRWGRLFLERFNKEEAANEFTEALKIQKDYPPALIGLARVAGDGFDKKAVEMAEAAIAQDPKLSEAREFLGMLAIEDSDHKRAREQADLALKIDPESLDAMAVHATVDLLEDKNDTPWLPRLLKINPGYGEAYNIAAYFFTINRRYEEAIGLYKKAIELDPTLYEAWSQLGVQLMRLAREDEARKCLTTAYEGGFRDAATVNSLTLMDSYKNFITYRHPRYTLRLHKKEAELLRPYMEEQMEAILETYDKKYGFTLKEHVQLEVYPDHEDFAVRTIGMPGMGALGVTFGSIVAMDSPSGRKPGSFHWASTLWHEMSHVYSLTATKNRISRWFTEGLAVYEETATRPDWGDRVDPEILKAIKEKKLLPVAQLERGFVRPSFPNQIIISYFQAGRTANYIEKKWGHAKLIEMMNAYRRPVTVDELIKKHLGITPEEFDKQFFAWIDEQFKRTAEGLPEWMKKVKDLNDGQRKAKNWDLIIKEAPALRDLYPDYVENGNLYELLAEAYEAKQQPEKAVDELLRYAKAGGRDPGVLMRLGEKLDAYNRKAEAANVLESLNLIYPVQDEKLHQKLGSLYTSLNNPAGAIREYRAVLSSKPVDKAAAHYQLARVLASAKRTKEAEDEVLNALELAPGYKLAQKLLLELSAQQK